MTTLQTNKWYFEKLNPVVVAAIGSFVLSILAYIHSQPVNPDGILYLITADIYLTSGLQAATTHYPWPFYSILIGLFSQATHLSFLHSAQLINSVLATFLARNFIVLIKNLNASKTAQWLAVLIILSYPGLNGTRDLIIRDFGYWAFLLFALNQLFYLQTTMRWRHAILWFISSGIAATFRIEGIIVSALLPLVFLFTTQSFSNKLHILKKIYLLPILSVLAFFIWYFSHKQHAPTNIGRLVDIKNEIMDGLRILQGNLLDKAQVVSRSVIAYPSIGDAKIFVSGGLVLTFIWTFISTLYPLQFLLAIDAFIKKLLPADRNQKIILFGFIIINLIIILFFVFQKFFLSERYIMALCLSILPFAIFSLEKIWQNWKLKQTKLSWLFPVIVVVLLIAGCRGIIHLNHSKGYLIDAGTWVKNNSAANATVFSNSSQVIFYSKRTPIIWPRDSDPTPLSNYLSSNPNWQQANYIMIVSTPDDAEADEKVFAEQFKIAPIKVFTNQKGNKVVIFEWKKL